MKRIALISIIISFVIGLSVGIFDLFHPIILDECGEWANPRMYDSSSEYWKIMIKDAYTWALIVMFLSYLPVFLLLLLGKTIKSKFIVDSRVKD